MFDKIVFGNNVKTLRLQSHTTQSQLGALLKVTKTQVSDIENGKTTTTLEKTYILADFFNVSVDYLLGRTDNPEVNR